MSVKVWLICRDVIRFERPLLRCVSWSVLELIYHMKSVSDFFFFFSHPYSKHFSLNISGNMMQWNSNTGKTDQVLRIHPGKNNQSEMNKKAFLQRELGAMTRGILVFSISLLGPLPDRLFFLDLYTSALHPSHKLDQENEAVSWSNITFRQQDLQAIRKIM